MIPGHASRTTVHAISLSLLAVLVAGTAAGAQDTTARCDSISRTPNAPLFTRRDVVMFAGAALATVAVAPLDGTVERKAYHADLRHRDVRSAASVFGFTGGPGPFIAGGALYLGGRTLGSDEVARLGLTLTEGVVVAATLNGVVKGFAGRELPNVKTRDPGDFSFGRGFHDGNGPFVSFPSGHTAASFAMASVLAEESHSWGQGASRIVPPLAYTTATLVGISRLYENVHWASDLPLGAAIGVWSGKTVAHWQRRHPDNWLTRRLLGVGAAPQKHGFSVVAAISPEAP